MQLMIMLMMMEEGNVVARGVEDGDRQAGGHSDSGPEEFRSC